MPLRYPPRLRARPTRADAQGEGAGSDLDEVGSWDLGREVIRQSIEGATRQTYAWMRLLLALTVLIFLVLALSNAPAVAYLCWLGVYALATVTQTGWRRRPGPRPRREQDDTSGQPP